MSHLGLVGSAAAHLPSGVTAATGLQLRIEDALASARRLWVRGRLLGLEAAAQGSGEAHWWTRWWGSRGTESPPPTAELETQVSGCVLRATIPLQADGRFEALLPIDLPPARRGWRVARNRLTLGTQTLERCGIVVAPAAGVPAVLIVVLALANTCPASGPQDLVASDQAKRLTSSLQRLQRQAHGHLPVYYLAVADALEEKRQVELALAVTALGWPPGCMIVLPGAGEAGLVQGIARLRWLFAGGPELHVINLEPRVARLLEESCQPKSDQAPVGQLTQPDAVSLAQLETRLCGGSGPGHQAPRPTRSSRITHYPVVFCHGMLAFSTLRMQLPEDLNYFTPLREFLAQRGFRALYPQVAPTAGVAERAASLRDQIQCWTNEPVNIVAHSMGGLDARFLISRLGMAGRVRSLTTISTPHRGTYLADWFTAHFRQRIPLLMAMEALGMNVDGFRDCRLEACRTFNAATPDAPSVQYFSYGGEAAASRLSPLLRRSGSILTPVEGPNDGLVSIASARWGEYLGTLHADHFAQTPDAVYLRPGEDFDSLGFFTRLVEDLARRGF